MTSDLPATATTFEIAVIRATSVIACLQQWLDRPVTDRPIGGDELELLHLSSLAVLTRQRGMHLVQDTSSPVEIRSLAEVRSALAAAHEDLVDSMPIPCSFTTLQFINETAALVQGVTRHVERD